MDSSATIKSLEAIELTIDVLESQIMQLRNEAAKLRNCLPAAITGAISGGPHQPVSDAEIANVLVLRQRTLSKRKNRTRERSA